MAGSGCWVRVWDPSPCQSQAGALTPSHSHPHSPGSLEQRLSPSPGVHKGHTEILVPLPTFQRMSLALYQEFQFPVINRIEGTVYKQGAPVGQGTWGQDVSPADAKGRVSALSPCAAVVCVFQF